MLVFASDTFDPLTAGHVPSCTKSRTAIIFFCTKSWTAFSYYSIQNCERNLSYVDLLELTE